MVKSQYPIQITHFHHSADADATPQLGEDAPGREKWFHMNSLLALTIVQSLNLLLVMVLFHS